jgi:hypothetical protein
VVAKRGCAAVSTVSSYLTAPRGRMAEDAAPNAYIQLLFLLAFVLGFSAVAFHSCKHLSLTPSTPHTADASQGSRCC